MSESFLDLVARELARARELYPMPMNSFAEGFFVLEEEVDELKAEVRKKPHKIDYNEALAECVQIAAMAQRFAEDLILSKTKAEEKCFHRFNPVSEQFGSPMRCLTCGEELP